MKQTSLETALLSLDVEAMRQAIDPIAETACQVAVTYRQIATRRARALQGTTDAVALFKAANDLHAALERAHAYFRIAMNDAKAARDRAAALLEQPEERGSPRRR